MVALVVAPRPLCMTLHLLSAMPVMTRAWPANRSINHEDLKLLPRPHPQTHPQIWARSGGQSWEELGILQNTIILRSRQEFTKQAQSEETQALPLHLREKLPKEKLLPLNP
jgi:hypothetical protein